MLTNIEIRFEYQHHLLENVFRVFNKYGVELKDIEEKSQLLVTRYSS